ncbi:MAG: hypothetical protein A2V88_09240 [Elusimicrobia bacterium RBG_16_66_12]|nr:MAG: hypothetical protein A2V88_09240 [Elusimicrobia bacterium RBG_16_66_12]
MGGAFTGLADDASAIFYNPAGLARQRGSLMLEHVPVSESGTGFAFGGGRLNFFGLGFPSRYGTFGFGFYQFAIGGIEARQQLSDTAQSLNVTQTAYFVPWGATYKGWQLGATAKAVSYSLAGYKATGYGADLGLKRAIYRGDTFLGRDTNIYAGAAVRNAMAPTLRLDQDSTPLERVTAFGLALVSYTRENYEAAADHVTHDRLALALDATKGNQDTSLGFAFGAEYAYLDRYAVRWGLNADRNMTIGMGAGGPNSVFRFDFTSVLAPLAPQHRMTVSWLFTAPQEAVEGSVKLSAYRRAMLDQQRLRDRFVKEGRDAAAEGRYGAALAAFEKARVLSPRDEEISSLILSGGEGNLLAGVKERIDAARREHAAGNGKLAATNALSAIVFDPESREAAEYAIQLRHAMILTKGPKAFDKTRDAVLEDLGKQFKAAAQARNIDSMRRVLPRLKAVDPDDSYSWQPTEEEFTALSATWLNEYLAAAAAASNAKDAAAMARAVRRVHRIDPTHKELKALYKRVRKLSKSAGSSFYDSNYLAQLYATAAAGYVLDNSETALQNLAALMRANATHEDGNALIDLMRSEGMISEEQEP